MKIIRNDRELHHNSLIAYYYRPLLNPYICKCVCLKFKTHSRRPSLLIRNFTTHTDACILITPPHDGKCIQDNIMSTKDDATR